MNGLPRAFDRIANNMTDYLRSNSATGKTSGTMYNETFVSVTWAWFALPVALALLSFLFLISYISRGLRQKSEFLTGWKANGLPLLLYGIDSGWVNRGESRWGEAETTSICS